MATGDGVRGPCAKCGRTMLAQGHPLPPGCMRHAGRRLCTACYNAALLSGRLEQYPRVLRSAAERDDLVARFLRLRETEALTMQQAAERLGVTRTNLYGLIKASPVVPPPMSPAELARLRVQVGVS